MSTTASPLRHLPQRLQIYARFPIGVLLAWIGAAFLLLASQPDPATFATGSESGGYGTSTPAFAEVSGTDPLRIERAGEVLVVTGGSLSGATLAPSGMPGVIELRSAGGPLARRSARPTRKGKCS